MPLSPGGAVMTMTLMFVRLRSIADEPICRPTHIVPVRTEPASLSVLWPYCGIQIEYNQHWEKVSEEAAEKELCSLCRITCNYAQFHPVTVRPAAAHA